jgi:hypothetical protein
MVTEERRSHARTISGQGLSGALTSRLVVVILCLAALLKICILFSILPTRIKQWDFGQLYASSLILREHGDPYTNDFASVGAALSIDMTPGYRSAEMPTLLLFLEPLTKLPVERAYWIWTGLNIIALALALFMLLRPSVSGLSPPMISALVALALLYSPVSVEFAYAQTQIVILLLLVAAMRSMARSNHLAAAILLAAAGLLRAFPLLLIGYLFVRREWRTFWYSIASLIVGAALVVATVGAPCVSFVRAVGWAGQRIYLQIPVNYALGAVVSRLFWNTSGFALGLQHDFVRIITMGLAEAALLGFTIKATLKVGEEDRDWRAFSLWIVSFVLMSPITWLHYMVLLIIPYYQLAIASLRGRASKRALWMAVASYMLLGLSRTGGSTIRSLHPFIPALQACGFVALMMMYIAVYWFTIDPPDSTETIVREQLAETGRGLTLTGHTSR